MKTVFRILAGGLCLYNLYLVYSLIRNPFMGYEKYGPIMCGLLALMFGIFAIAGRSGIPGSGPLEFDQELPSKSFGGGRPLWLNAGLIIGLMAFLGWLCLFVLEK